MELVRAVRAARGIEVSPRPAGSASKLCDHEKCPHCDRQFGPKAYDRHIEWCKEQKARIPKSPSSSKAKERLEARLKYRAPALMKSRPMLIRDKYSSAANLLKSGPPATATPATPSEQQPQKSPVAAEKTPSRPHEVVRQASKPTLQRNASISGPRSSMRQRSISPVKRVSTQAAKTASSPKSEAIPQSRKGKDAKLKDLVSPNSNSMRQKVNAPVSTPQPHPPTPKSKGDDIQEKSCEEIYNPYHSAEQQMQDLLFGAAPPPPSSRPTVRSAPSPSSAAAPLPSAFAKYSPPPPPSPPRWSGSLHELDEIFLAAESGGFLPPPFCNLPDDASGSSLSLCSHFPESFEKGRRVSKIRAKMESASLSLQQSVSLVNYDGEPKRPEEPVRNGFLSISEEKPLVIANLKDVTDSGSTNGNGLPEEVAKENLMNNNNDGDNDSKALEELFTPIANNRYSTASKNSADSAYSSLSRRSPHQTMVDREGNDMEQRYPTICSSGSESSLPPIGVGQRENTEGAVTEPAQISKLSKFCHECGSKYPVNLAKFCCECGVRRLFV